jgi:hypothetical protein
MKNSKNHEIDILGKSDLRLVNINAGGFDDGKSLSDCSFTEGLYLSPKSKAALNAISHN